MSDVDGNFITDSKQLNDGSLINDVTGLERERVDDFVTTVLKDLF